MMGARRWWQSISLRAYHRGAAVVVALLITASLLSSCTIGKTDDNIPGTADQISEATTTLPPTPLPIYVPSPTPTPLPPPTNTPLVQPTPEVAESALTTRVDELLASEPGIFGVVILDQEDNYLYAANATVPFVAASLFKLVLVADIFEKIESGALTRNQEVLLQPAFFEGDAVADDSYYDPDAAGTSVTIDELLLATAAYSSNIAARALMTLTSPDELRADAVALGMPDTYFFVNPQELSDWPERFDDPGNPDETEAIAFVEAQALNDEVNITTPNDIGHYWYLMLNNQLLSPEVSQDVLALLKQQVITDRLPALLPEEIETANKTGNLSFVVHDSGVLFLPDGNRIVVALSQGAPSVDHAAEVIQRIGLLASGETEIPPYSTPEPPDGEADPADNETSDEG